MDIITNEATSYFNQIRDTLYNAFMEKGVLLRPLGNVLYIMPPYCITNNELQIVYRAIEDTLNQL